MKPLKLFACILVVLLAGCTKTRTVVSGEISVAPEGEDKFALGLVDVIAYPERVINNRMIGYKDKLADDEQKYKKAMEDCSKTPPPSSFASEESYALLLQTDRDCFTSAQNRQAEMMDFLFATPGPPNATSLTNSEGRFSIKIVGSGSFYIFAKGRRPVAGGFEQYFWLSRVTTDGTPQQIMFTNYNAMDVEQLKTLLADISK